jgi:hypothetical protein
VERSPGARNGLVSGLLLIIILIASRIVFGANWLPNLIVLFVAGTVVGSVGVWFTYRGRP